MSKYQQILREIEHQWPIHIHRGLAELRQAHPSEVLYAASFWMLYCDYTNIAAPTFGVNAESNLVNEVPGGHSNRWLPPEWRWDVLDSVCSAMEPHYTHLSKLLASASNDDWDAVIASNEHLIARVCRLVTHAARTRSGAFGDLELPKDFLLFAADVREDDAKYDQLLRLSVDPEVLASTEGLLITDM
jgi:hypothetical protein